MKNYFSLLFILFSSLGLSAQNISIEGSESSESITCDTTLWDHVYARSRLVLIQDCMTVTGVVDTNIFEVDGDVHMRLHLDSAYTYMLNQVNIDDQFGDLVCEAVCVNSAILITACDNYVNTVYIPNIGEHVMVMGPYITDIWHGWNELHPVTSISIISSTVNIGLKNDGVSFSVFPNPASDEINFVFDKNPSTPVFISIIDNLGRTAGKFQLLNSLNFKYNTASLPDGIYYYNIVQGASVLKSGNFAVSHSDRKAK